MGQILCADKVLRLLGVRIVCYYGCCCGRAGQESSG